MSYDLHSAFDIVQHKAHYVNYLEVIIKPEGTVEYAVPSHQRKLENVLAKQRGITVENVRDLCPKDMYYNYQQWLCNMTGCVSVWNSFAILPDVFTQSQEDTIHQLIEAGLFKPTYEVSLCHLE